MLETYTIDTTLLGKVKKRMFKRTALTMLIPIVVVFIPNFLNRRNTDWQLMGVTFAFFIVLMGFTLIRTINRQVNSIKTLKIVLNEEGIERKADLQPYKRLEWDCIAVKEKPNGSILLYDKNVSGFMRWMYGKGVIYILPEIIDKDRLLNTIRTKAPYAFY